MTHHLREADRLSLNLLLVNLPDYMKNTILLLSSGADYKNQEKGNTDNNQETKEKFVESFVEHRSYYSSLSGGVGLFWALFRSPPLPPCTKDDGERCKQVQEV